MAIRFSCPQCQQRLSVATQKAEQDVKCPRCRQIVRVPAERARSTGSSAPPPLPPGYETVVPQVSVAERVDELVYAEDDGELAASHGRAGQTGLGAAADHLLVRVFCWEPWHWCSLSSG